MQRAIRFCFVVMAVLSTGMATQPGTVVTKKDSRYIASLNKRTFESNIASDFAENWIVMFCVDWYAPCVEMQRSYMVIAERYDAKQNSDTELLRSTVRFAAVDCAVDKVLCNTQLVDDYPAVRHYREGKIHASWKPIGKQKTGKSVMAWLDKTLTAPAPRADPAVSATSVLTASEHALLLRLVASALAIAAAIGWSVSRGAELWAAVASVRRQGGCIQAGAKSRCAGNGTEANDSDVRCANGNGVEPNLPSEWLQRGGMDL
mmetsp:Transcript_61749/g.122188  ORF Transcript_61749/g.122188 Transcript_61749/m.122188 type:complete len:261 (+) Transcript_61749:150-932(+)